MSNRNKYRFNPSAQRVRPVPHTESMELQAFLNDLRKESGSAMCIRNENGTDTPVRIINGKLQYFSESDGWLDLLTQEQTDEITSEPQDTAVQSVAVPSANISQGSYVEGDDEDNAYAELDTDETSSNYGKLLTEQLCSHTHTKSEITDFSHTHTVSDITDFPTGVSGTFEIDGYNYTFTNGILTAREAVNNGE